MAVSRKSKPEFSRVEQLWLSDGELAAGDEPLDLMEDNVLTWLHTGQNGYGDKARELIAKHGDAALAAFTAEYPGQRPGWWWKHRAPEPMRQRVGVGGTGTARHWHETGVRHANQQDAYGVPLVWVTLENAAWWGTPPGPPVDPNDPPLYESQAAYLRRHGLLSDAEIAILGDDDFAPEVFGDA